MILSKASRLALYALTEMALHPDSLVSAAMVAARFDLSENHIAKVLQQLTRAGYVESVRGAGGGYRLARQARDITMAEVVATLEGPASVDPCADCPMHAKNAGCSERATCSVHGLLSELGSHVQARLESVTIATLARSTAGKKELVRARR